MRISGVVLALWTFDIISLRFCGSNLSAIVNHFASNSILKLGSVSTSAIIALYLSIISDSLAFRAAPSKRLFC